VIDKKFLANPKLFVDPVHDGRHALRDAPLMRESIPYVLCLPDEKIGAFFYTWVSRDSVAGFACAIFGPGVPGGPIIERIDNIAVPAQQNFNNWKVGRFQMQHDLEMYGARVEWSSEKASVAFNFEAIHPCYGYGNDPRGCPSFLADDRTEQAGRITGTLTLGGKTIKLDTTGHRDHSWGARDWDMAHHWKWLVAQAGPNVAIHVFQIFVRGRIELRGYVYKDNLLSEVTGFDCDFELDRELRQKNLSGMITDALGRKTRFAGDVFGVQLLPPEPQVALYEGAMSIVIDGKPGTGYVEFKWPTSDVEHAKRSPL